MQPRPLPLLLSKQTALQHLRGPQHQQGLRPQLLVVVAASFRLPAQRSPRCCLLVNLSPLTRLLQQVMACPHRMTILQGGRVYHQGLRWALLALLLTQPPRLLLVTQCCRQQQQHQRLSWLPPQQVLAPPLRCQQGRNTLHLLPARCCPFARTSCPQELPQRLELLQQQLQPPQRGPRKLFLQLWQVHLPEGNRPQRWNRPLASEQAPPPPA